MKKIRVSVMTLLMIGCLSACSNSTKEITETTVEIGKDGQVTGTIVEAFDKEYYDIGELEEMAKQEIEDYNSQAGNGRVELVSLTQEGTNVIMVISYDSAEDYTKFNEKTLFYGTIEEAAEQGYLQQAEVIEVGNVEAVITEETLMGMSSKMIVVAEEPVRIMTSGKMTHFSEGVNILESKREAVLTESASGLFYIIMK